MDTTTPNLKEQLAAAVEAYAAARTTGNPLLLRFASQTLSSFLEDIEITQLDKGSQGTVPMTLPNP